MPLKNNILCALFAALLAICAWLSLPVADISFTMQTFGVFTALGLLGGKRGTLSIALYLLLGIAGLPVFAGFQGGLGVLLGSTGGYIWGFLLAGLVYWTIIKLLQDTSKSRFLAFCLGLLTCYVTGTAWFFFLYLNNGSPLSLGVVLARCVVPYLLPDLGKLLLAWLVTNRLKRFVPSQA